MSDLVARAEAVLEGVTAGPWVVNRDGWACVSSGSYSVFHGYFEGTCGDCGDEILDAAKVAISIEDAEFIAAARTLVPDLVAEVKAARAELVELGSIFDALVEKSRQTHGELKAARASEERHLHEIFHLQDDLKAARAEVERLTVVIDRIDGLHVESSMWPGKCCGCEYGSSSPCVTASVIERLRGETR